MFIDLLKTIKAICSHYMKNSPLFFLVRFSICCFLKADILVFSLACLTRLCEIHLFLFVRAKLAKDCLLHSL